MKKITFILGLIAFNSNGYSQDGLEGIIVEKYYVSNAADALGSLSTLPEGSVTYRIYADMLPGYRFQALYGDVNHAFKVSTTTTFFNNEDRGAITANQIASAQLKNNSVALDSWFSVGAVAAGQFGVLKTEDDGVANLLPISSNSMLKNADASAGIPLSVQDGMIAGSPEVVTLVGFSNELDFFDATSQAGSSFTLNDHAIAALFGAVGPTAENKLLLGQFTTDGIFSFELNIQIGTPVPQVSQNYVTSNPILNEITIPSLTLVANTPPTITLSAASTATAGDVVVLTATAADTDGTITQVEFFVDNVSIGVDVSSPYTYDWTAIVGAHNFKAIATDNIGATKTSSISSINVNVLGNVAPIISLIPPLAAVKNDVVTLFANASDTDGTITQVEFFVDNVSVGVDLTSPYSVTWTAVTGAHVLKAIATDNSLATTTSSLINITVTDPVSGINELNGVDQLVSVYPNPATSELSISIVNAKVSTDNFYLIHDYKGALVVKNELGHIANEYVQTIDVSTFPKGVYFITVSLAGEKTIKKITVQ